MSKKTIVQLERGETPQSARDFLREDELLQRVPVSRRTLRDWRAKGVLPFIQQDRAVIYHWDTVKAALLRMQKGIRV